MDIKPIKNERDYEKALRRAESLWKSPEGSAESDELDVLATLIEAYEGEHYPMDLPDSEIRVKIEQGYAAAHRGELIDSHQVRSRLDESKRAWLSKRPRGNPRTL